MYVPLVSFQVLTIFFVDQHKLAFQYLGQYAQGIARKTNAGYWKIYRMGLMGPFSYIEPVYSSVNTRGNDF